MQSLHIPKKVGKVYNINVFGAFLSRPVGVVNNAFTLLTLTKKLCVLRVSVVKMLDEVKRGK